MRESTWNSLKGKLHSSPAHASSPRQREVFAAGAALHPSRNCGASAPNRLAKRSAANDGRSTCRSRPRRHRERVSSHATAPTSTSSSTRGAIPQARSPSRRAALACRMGAQALRHITSRTRGVSPHLRASRTGGRQRSGGVRAPPAAYIACQHRESGLITIRARSRRESEVGGACRLIRAPPHERGSRDLAHRAEKERDAQRWRELTKGFRSGGATARRSEVGVSGLGQGFVHWDGTWSPSTAAAVWRNEVRRLLPPGR